MALLIEQLLNGIQLGLLMFLLAAGLTLVFGIMDLVNLAHGSLYMRGAFLAAMLVGVIDTFGRAYLPQVLKTFLSTTAASTAALAMASMLIYVLMATLLVWRPTGLFGARN